MCIRDRPCFAPTPDSEVQMQRKLRRLEGEQKVQCTRETSGMIEELQFDIAQKRKRRLSGQYYY